MIKQISRVAFRMFAVCAILGLYSHHSLFAQEVTGDHEIRWIRVGKLHSWFSNAGTEVEYGRRGRAQFEDYDQADLLSWDAQYYRVERCVAHALWIGCTNFKDPSPLANGQTFPYKTVVAGIAFANTLTNFMPYNFKMP